ncbi:MAG: hypothetical protein OER77_17575, partial [Myxococcales bacterium]|nr:hypothetical protein [Myxococcales bacterium]
EAPLYNTRSVFWLGVLATMLSVGPGLAAAQEESSREKANREFIWQKEHMWVVEPSPGYDKVPALNLSWCKGVTPQRNQDKASVSWRISRTVKVTAQRGYSAETTSRLLYDFCEYPDDPGFQTQAGYAVQLWVNQTGQSKDEAIQSMVARMNIDKWNKDLKKGCDKFQISEEASLEEEEMATARLALFGCGNLPFYLFRQEFSKTYVWYIDQTHTPPSELDRLTYALQCLPLGNREWNKRDWLTVGMCSHDIRALDPAKLVKETAGMGTPFRSIALESYAKAKAILGELERSVKKEVGTDRDYQKLLYDAPNAAWRNWVRRYKKHKKAIDATFAFEKDVFGPSQTAYATCSKTLEPGMRKFVKAGKFKTKEAFLEAMQGPIGSVLVNALGACYAVTSPANVGDLLLKINDNSRVWRGPRAAVRHAMIDVLNDIKNDRDRFPVTFTHFPTYSTNLIRWQAYKSNRSRIPSSGGYGEIASGVVKTFKKEADQLLRATFKTASWTEQSYRCVETNRVDFIEDGIVHYGRKCTKAGEVTKSFTPQTTILFDWAAKGIKPNAFVVMKVPVGTQHLPQPRRGHPIEVYTNAEKKKLLNMYGFAL